mmetsp:Transcript_1619/g.2329  ORF Transcript_1619/g.2329 Transcript_1619/m.2329 type:complete len:87 (-) Transcript_1619:235-495(-)
MGRVVTATMHACAQNKLVWRDQTGSINVSSPPPSPPPQQINDSGVRASEGLAPRHEKCIVSYPNPPRRTEAEESPRRGRDFTWYVW